MLQVLRKSVVWEKCLKNRLRNDWQYHVKPWYSTQTGLKEDDAEEVRIPVPWGHIAGKWWGRKDGIPMLGIHGWQDNAGSFDKIVPHLNVSNFLAIDLPGHGFSSHMPPGKVYTFPEYVYSIRRVIDYFKWKKYSILGHSLGSALGMTHAAIYKDEVEYLISLECARYLLLAYRDDFPKQIAKGLDKILEYDKIMQGDTPPGYTFPEAIKAFIAGSLGSITSHESASTLLKRGATKVKASEVSSTKKNKTTDLKVFLQHELSKTGSKSEVNEKVEDYEKLLKDIDKSPGMTDSGEYLYLFTKDPRVKMIQFGLLNMEIIKEISCNITCPVLAMQADQGFLRFGSEKLYKMGNDIMKKHSKHFEHHVVKGNHHFQLNNPENVAPVINSFLERIGGSPHIRRKPDLKNVINARRVFLLSGKYWGPKNNTTFLLAHGWQDNAGSFDTLIPLLSNKYSYLAIDLPGHGYSSHYTSGVAYTIYDAVANFRRIQKHFSWPKMNLMGHSQGSSSAFLFTCLFPDSVDTYIGIDSFKPYSMDVKKFISQAKEDIRKYLEYDKLKPEEAEWYSEQEFIRKLKTVLKTERDDLCRILMKRGAVEKNGRFKKICDPRIEGIEPFGLTQSDNAELAERVKCNVLVIKGSESDYGEPVENFHDIFGILKKNAKCADLQIMPGTRHIHFETPEVIAPVINKFLSDTKSTV